jgi:acyl-CoA synthetase (AMP-forming)/AMP-acid ligase II
LELMERASTIRGLIAASAADRPDDPVLLDIDGGVTSYEQLRGDVDAIGAALVAAGVGADRAVAVVLPNGPLMATAFLGVSSVAVCAPLNPAYTQSELSFFYDDLDVAALVTDGCSPAAVALAEQRGVPVLQPPFEAAPTSTRSAREPDDVALN